jgi:hypothetical protein
LHELELRWLATNEMGQISTLVGRSEDPAAHLKQVNVLTQIGKLSKNANAGELLQTFKYLYV